MNEFDIGRLAGQFMIDLVVGMAATFGLRSIPPLRRWPSLPYWGGAAISTLMGLIVINRSPPTVIVGALAGCIIVLRHYLTLPKQAVK